MIYGVACLSWPAWWGLQSRWLEARIKTKILAHLSPLVLFRIQSPSVGLLEAQHPTDCWSGHRITSRKKRCSQTGEAGGQHSQDLSRPEPEHLITTYLGASSYPPRPARGVGAHTQPWGCILQCFYSLAFRRRGAHWQRLAGQSPPPRSPPGSHVPAFSSQFFSAQSLAGSCHLHLPRMAYPQVRVIKHRDSLRRGCEHLSYL